MDTHALKVNQFIARWERAEANEQGDAQLWIGELMALLDVGRPDPSRKESKLNTNAFERAVPLRRPDGRTTSGRIDYYLQGKLIVECKQSASPLPTPFPFPLSAAQMARLRSAGVRRGSAALDTPQWDRMMVRAFPQADEYARSLPADEAVPPFIIISDNAKFLDIYANFNGEAGYYTPFPNAREHRIQLADLRDPAIFNRLRAIWTDPLSLDKTRETERVTTDLARRLGDFAVALEDDGHAPGDVASFLMRFIATAYAEDVRLLPAGSFTRFIASVAEAPERFVPQMGGIWEAMVEGGTCQTLHCEVSHFGPFFKNAPVIALNPVQLRLLLDAAEANWALVDPSLFGAILERALSNRERFKLGAYFTSRTVVERMIIPTIIQPLRREWAEAKSAVWKQLAAGDIDGARKTVYEFQKRLSRATVLDPAAGSGNILFVTFEHLKTLEEEVVAALRDLGVADWHEVDTEHHVSPNQLFGIEVNPKAAAVSELILHLSYLKWHFRTKGNVKPPEPILRERWAIDCRDAVLAWDAPEAESEVKANPPTRYLNPRPTEWPEVEFVVGNPPYIGGSKRREALGVDYNNALAAAYPWIPRSADYCMLWVDKAARLARSGKLSGFGFITTSSIKQGVNRNLVRQHLAGDAMPTGRGQKAEAAPPLSIIHAIPDHDWDGDGASVKVSITSFRSGSHDGTLALFKSQSERRRDPKASPFTYQEGRINAGLVVGPDVSGAVPLQANKNLTNRGVELSGNGFILTKAQAKELGLGRIDGIDAYIRQYRNGRDLAVRAREVLVIDLFDLSEEQVKKKYSGIYDWILTRVKPERDKNNDNHRRQNWWILGRPSPAMREAINELPRYIATVQTVARRYFLFLDANILPDSTLVTIASEDAYHLGILSSHAHTMWSMATGGRRGEGPRYNNTLTFDTFPFPDATEEQKDRIRLWAERLDAHRKERQAMFPELTLTGLYAALYKLHAQEDWSVADQRMAEWGDLDALAAIHDELDEAVADAYGWPVGLPDTEILQRLLDLNAVRAAEEKKGEVKYLRPEYQNPQAAPQSKDAADGKPQAFYRPRLEEKDDSACKSFMMVAA